MGNWGHPGDLADVDDGLGGEKTMTPRETVLHKAKIGLVAIKDPQRLMVALQYILSAYVAVIATLKLQFAKTLSLCLAIAEILEVPCVALLGPIVAVAMGPDLKHWVATSISLTIKIIAIIVACYVQAIVSAFYSG